MTRLTLICVIVTACASANVMRLDGVQQTERQPDSVQFFLGEPDRPYVSIALIEVPDEGWGLSLETLRLKFGEEAAKLGADAVIVGRRAPAATPLSSNPCPTCSLDIWGTDRDAGAVLVPVSNQWCAPNGNQWCAGMNVEESRLLGNVIVFIGSPPKRRATRSP
jgi:hypothetical protein